MNARSRIACILAAAIAFLPPVARAADCGTVVLPAGFGQGDPQGITSLSPLLSNSVYNNQVIYQLYRPLVWLDRDVRYDPADSLASAVGTIDGGRTYRLTLKPWLWSDGVPVTAADVVFTFDLIRRIGPGFVFYKVGGIPDMIDRVTALSAHEVEIRLTRRVNPEWFLGLGLGNTIKPLPEHVYRGMGLREIRARQTDPRLFAVSDGPFLLADFEVGRHLTLVPNPLYGGQHPHIRRLVIDFLEGGNPLQALRSGEIDGAQVPYRLWDLARGLPGMRVQALDGPFSYAAMILNFRSRHAPFLRDQAVREAITLGIDQEQVIALAEHGQGRVIHGPVPVAMTGFLSPQARAGYPSLDHDPARARALLDRDGWVPGPDGIRVKQGRRLEFGIAVSSGVADRLIALQVAQRNLATIGVALDIRGVEFNELLATLGGNGHDWDSVMLAWTVTSYPDETQIYSSDGAANYGHFDDPRVDALNREVVTSLDRQPLFAVQDYLALHEPYIFLPQPRVSVLTREGLDGAAAMVSPMGNWSPEKLTLSGPLACPDGHRETADAHPLGH